MAGVNNLLVTFLFLVSNISFFSHLKATHPNHKEILIVSHELGDGIAENSILVDHLDSLLDLGGGGGSTVPPAKTNRPGNHW